MQRVLIMRTETDSFQCSQHRLECPVGEPTDPTYVRQILDHCGKRHHPDHPRLIRSPNNPTQALEVGWKLLAPPERIKYASHVSYKWWFVREDVHCAGR